MTGWPDGETPPSGMLPAVGVTDRTGTLKTENKTKISASIPIERVSLKHDGTDGPVKLVNTDGTAIERADGTAKTSVN